LTTPAPAFRLGYHPSLDGLRGVAILLVMLYHFGTPVLGGAVGVDVFFVLSGFLITALIVGEVQRDGRLDFAAFYRRRALRLLPALFTLLLVLVGATVLFRSRYREEAIRESWMALLYSLNWFKAYGRVPENNYLGHTWSLCIEEQFYLLWPWMLAAMLRFRLRTVAILGLVASGVLLSAGMRALHWTMYHDWDRVYHGLDSRADGLLVGSLLALVLSRMPAAETSSRRRTAAGWLGVAVLLTLSFLPLTPFYLVGGIPIANVSTAAILAALLAGPPGGLLRRVFEARPLVWVGKISYGLYLWHVMVPHLLMKMSLRSKPWSIALEAGLSLVLATASYYGLERYFLQHKQRPPAATSTP